MVKAACWGARNYIAPERIRMRQIIWELLLYQLYCMNYTVPITVREATAHQNSDSQNRKT